MTQLGGRAQEARAFHADRPTDLRRARPWHRLSHIIVRLPIAIREMVPLLGVAAGDRVLDFGCADRPYDDLFPQSDLVGADLPGNPRADLFLTDDGRVPVEDGAFDAVLSTQVLEHVVDPAGYLDECFRVLKPGGRVLVSTHGIMVLHPDPVDYWRWTSEGLRFQLEQSGFEVTHFEGVMGLAATGLQLVQDAWYHRVPTRLRRPLALVMQTCIRLVDRIESREDRRANALVFVLVARKPHR